MILFLAGLVVGWIIYYLYDLYRDFKKPKIPISIVLGQIGFHAMIKDKHFRQLLEKNFSGLTIDAKNEGKKEDE